MNGLHDDRPPRGRGAQSTRFLVLYALAAAGGATSYAPFLSILLPLQVNAQWGAEGVRVLSYCAFTGAVAASISNIVVGWLSDLTGSRQGWIVGGLILSSVLLLSMRFAENVPTLLAMIVVWQIGLNMMLNPLMAMAGDHIPDEQKGMLGGMLALSPAVGALVGALVTIPGFADAGMRATLIAAITALLIVPLLAFGRPVAIPALVTPVAADTASGTLPPLITGHAVRRMWLSRLLIQIGEATMFAFLLMWFISLDHTLTESFTARLFTVVLFAAVPLAMAVGQWSDRAGKPFMPLVILSGIAACGMLTIALSTTPTGGAIGYVIFGLSAGVFLALHSGQTLRILPRPQTRGRDLGLFNLTNTVPSLIMPWLTLALVPLFGFGTLFMILAGLCAIACVLLGTIQGKATA
ncbi:MFS transporter [Altererythrobacter sp. FM1]|uniref:MFS transporter n=1 Tax=Tsuneonella flava TaxID=2055955 RepID=UPI000C808061|nr:MFS transporter [Tsuneonella flava]ROT96928.1 MFS transporter [Altererythrobacter sp. FM1]